MYESVCEQTVLVFWDLSLIVELLGHKGTLYLTFRGTAQLFSTGTDHFTLVAVVHEGPDFFASSLTLDNVSTLLQPC